MSKKQGLTYKSVGVDYGAMDPFKIAATQAATETAGQLARFGFSEVAGTRGESCYLIETPVNYLAHVEEGLGTKNLVADAMYEVKEYLDTIDGVSFYNNIAQCTVAMIVNDMITLGAMPVSVAMHLAVGDSSWFDDLLRYQDLINGWKKACLLSRCAWGGGETPTLRDIIYPSTVVLSGSAIGIIYPKSRLITGNIKDGDAIVFLLSSGIHANGLTLARKIATKLKKGYATKLTDGRTYGQALLEPTCIYVPVIDDALSAGLDIHYTANITGHGWRKLMRHPENFHYMVEKIPEPGALFEIIQKQGGVTNKEAYGNLNMGAGFAVYLPFDQAAEFINIASENNIPAMLAGYIKKAETKEVIIEPIGITFEGKTLKIR